MSAWWMLLPIVGLGGWVTMLHFEVKNGSWRGPRGPAGPPGPPGPMAGLPSPEEIRTAVSAELDKRKFFSGVIGDDDMESGGARFEVRILRQQLLVNAEPVDEHMHGIETPTVVHQDHIQYREHPSERWRDVPVVHG